VSEAIVSMLTYRDGLLGGSVVLQGQSVSVKPSYVPSDSTPADREALLVGTAKLQLQEDNDYE
jgi:hypothetical protein